MKKLMAFTTLILVFLFGSNQLWAQDITNNIGIGARFMWLGPQTENYFGDKADLEGKSMFGGTLTYGVSRWLSLEVAFDSSLKTDLEKVIGIEAEVEKWVKVADVRVYPLTFSGQLRYIAGPEFYTWIVPYATFGFGRYFVDCDVAKEYKDHKGTEEVEIDIDDAWGGHLGGGFDIFLHKNIAFNFEFRYFWAESDIRERITLDTVFSEEKSGKMDLDSWMVGVGIKFYFGLFGK